MVGTRPIDIELRKVEKELADAGMQVGELGGRDISGQSEYPRAVEILLENLSRDDYSDHAKAVMASVLCVKKPAVRKAWQPLTEIYLTTPNETSMEHKGEVSIIASRAKMILANALVNAYTPKNLDALADLLADSANGQSRVILLAAIRRSRKRPEIAEILQKLADDPVLKEALQTWKM